MSQPKQPSNLCHSPATYVTAQQLMSKAEFGKGRVWQRQSLAKAEFGKDRVWQWQSMAQYGKAGVCTSWSLYKLESVKAGVCTSWSLYKLESVQAGVYTSWSLYKLESVKAVCKKLCVQSSVCKKQRV
jgi:hypothetical protein